MKITVFIFCLICLNFQTNAQLRFGLKAGYNKASAEYPNQPDLIKQSISAFQFGVLGELNIHKVLLKSNILFNQKGDYSDDSGILADDNRWVTYRLNYLEANILAGYKFKFNRHIGFSIAAGPFVGLGLSGTEKGKGSNLLGSFNIDDKIEFSNAKILNNRDVIFKPFDFGFDINASVNYKKFFLYFNWGKGLVNRTSSTSDEWKSRNKVFSVGVGYYLK